MLTTVIHTLQISLIMAITAASLVHWTAGNPTNEGKEFILGFTENVPWGPNKPQLLIVTDAVAPVTVTISCPLLPDHTFHPLTKTVHRNSTLVVDFPLYVEMRGTSVENKGILVTASDKIAVFGVNRQRFSNDGFIAIPTTALSVEYYAMSSTPLLGDNPAQSQIAVVATSDATHVNVELNPHTPNLTLTYNGSIYRGGDMIHVVLNRFQTFQIQSDIDLTGTKILSSSPIFALSGNVKTSISGLPNQNTGDHIVETLLPVNRWGKAFGLVPTAEDTTGNVYRIVGSQESIQMSLQCRNKMETYNVNARYIELPVEPEIPCYIESAAPISVYQFTRSVPVAGRRRGDPYAVYLQPVEQFLGKYTFSTPFLRGYKHYLNIMSSSNRINGLRLDDKPILANWTILTHAYFVTQLQITSGRHVLSHETPGATFGAYAYGKAFAESYAYPVGLGLLNLRCRTTAPRLNDGIDNDCDGRVDEELFNGRDDDGDGRRDEDFGFEIRGNRQTSTQPTRKGVASARGNSASFGGGSLGIENEFGGVTTEAIVTGTSAATVTGTSEFTSAGVTNTSGSGSGRENTTTTVRENADWNSTVSDLTTTTETVTMVTRETSVMNRTTTHGVLNHNSSTLKNPSSVPYDLLLAAITPLLLIVLSCILIIILCRRFRRTKNPPPSHRTAQAQTSGPIRTAAPCTRATQTDDAVFVMLSNTNCTESYSILSSRNNPKILNKQSSLVSIELSKKCKPHAYNFIKATGAYGKRGAFDNNNRGRDKTSPKLLRVNPNVYMTNESGRLGFPVLRHKPDQVSRTMRVTDIDW